MPRRATSCTRSGRRSPGGELPQRLLVVQAVARGAVVHQPGRRVQREQADRVQRAAVRVQRVAWRAARQPPEVLGLQFLQQQQVALDGALDAGPPLAADAGGRKEPRGQVAHREPSLAQHPRDPEEALDLMKLAGCHTGRMDLTCRAPVARLLPRTARKIL